MENKKPKKNLLGFGFIFGTFSSVGDSPLFGKNYVENNNN